MKNGSSRRKANKPNEIMLALCLALCLAELAGITVGLADSVFSVPYACRQGAAFALLAIALVFAALQGVQAIALFRLSAGSGSAYVAVQSLASLTFCFCNLPFFSIAVIAIFISSILFCMNPDGATLLRAVVRKGLIACILVASFLLVLTFVLSLLCYVNSWKTSLLAVICFSAMLVASMLVAIWGYVRLMTSTNPRFFSNLKLFSDDARLRVEPAPRTASTYLLYAFLRMRDCVPRIRESIRPGVGCCRLLSDIEFEVPPALRSIKELYVPIVIQGRAEMVNDLEVRCDACAVARRLNDGQVVDLFSRAVTGLFCARGWIVDDSEALNGFVAGVLRGASLTKTAGKDFGVERITKSQEAASFLRAFEKRLRRVKPICVSLKLSSEQSSWDKYITIKTERIVPLVPVRRPGTAAILIRKFTKRRMKYYFNLSGADCAQSYHLTFAGPSNTYLNTCQLLCMNEGTDLLFAEEMSVTNRYDQQNSRLYIRNGRGFKRAALSVSYEERGHKPVSALCAAAISSLLVMFYLALQFVFSEQDPQASPTSSDLVLPLTILTISSLASVWEAMEDHRAEEWLWLGGAITVVASLVASVDLVVLSVAASLSEAWRLATVAVMLACLVAEFVVALFAVLALFERIKQHGALMDRVPVTRYASSSNVDCITLAQYCEMEAIAKDDFQDGSEGAAAYHVSSGSFSKWGRYCEDIAQYSSLIGSDWSDGWLIPAWNAEISPYCAISKEHYDLYSGKRGSSS